LRLLALAICALAGLPAPVAAQDCPALSEGSNWYTLGTSGGPQVRAQRSQIANALVTRSGIYLFDVGNGVQTQMARAGLEEQAIRAIFLSHHHLDHVADLGPLLWTRWTFGGGPLTVVGPVGTRTLVENLIRAGEPIMLAGYPAGGPPKPDLSELVRIVELPADPRALTKAFSDDRIAVEAIAVDHYQSRPSIPLDTMPDAVAYRVNVDGRTVVYTGDSGPSKQLEIIAKDANLLVSELVSLPAITAVLQRQLARAPAAMRDGIVAGMAINHLAPETIGRLANGASVDRLVLTHFVPAPEDGLDVRAVKQAIALDYRGPVDAADDLDVFPVASCRSGLKD